MKRFDLGVLIAGVAILAGAGGFALGHYTAATFPQTASASSGASGGQGSGFAGGGGFRRGGFGTRGTVATVSGNTITMTDQNGTSHTVNVSSSTTYLNGADRSTAAQTDVTAGTTILAAGQTAADGSITATRIIINPPNFGGGGAPGGSNSGVAPGAVQSN